MIREIDTGIERHTTVSAIDEQDERGINHRYLIAPIVEAGMANDADHCTEILFQNGPIAERGTNGCHNEDLIAIVLDRLNAFQATEFTCEENAFAINALNQALSWLSLRTANRKARGVEGTHGI